MLAVKPQTMDAVLAELREAIQAADRTRLFISIAAGVPIARIERALGPRARVIRVMPNAPAMVGHGMAALVRGGKATNADAGLALRIFKAVGDAVELDDERLLDAVTALSGSGPAYVYLFVKALADAAVIEGLPPELGAQDGVADASRRGREHAPLSALGRRADSNRRVARRHHRSGAASIRRGGLF